MNWFREHKTLVGAIATGVAAALAYAGFTEAAAIVLSFGTLLIGGGALKSDQQSKLDR